MESITVLLMVVFGGMGSLPGSFVGASVLVIFSRAFKIPGHAKLSRRSLETDDLWAFAGYFDDLAAAGLNRQV